MKKILAYIYKIPPHIPVFIFLGFIVIQTIITNPGEKRKLADMQTEFKKINKLPNSIITFQDSRVGKDKTHISVHYSTSQSDDEIYSYYSNELLRNGWKLSDSENKIGWRMNIKERGVHYTKRNYTLSLSFDSNRKSGDAFSIFVEETRYIYKTN